MKRLVLTLALGLLAARPAAAQTDLFGRDTVSGFLDLRLGAADGEASFLRSGFGKTQYSGAQSGVAARAELDLAALAWRPELADGLTAYILVQNQPDQSHGIDLAESYLQYKPLIAGPVRYSLRGGLMWPPVSLEHDGAAWTTTRTLTPSAINTWVAEEVKVAALEGTLYGEIGEHRLSATAAVFGNNDTSGTLLSYRGWALHDIRATLFGTDPLPSGPPRFQAYAARPSLDLAGRPGGYAKLEWRPPAPIQLEVFYYDNAGDPHVFKDGQWGWRTTFTDVGLTARPAKDVEILAQALTGRTYFGNHSAAGWYLDVDYSSAYLLATKVHGRNRFTLRADWFKTQDNVRHAEDRDERGWAATADYAFTLSRHFSLWVEALHVWSNRPARFRLGEPATDPQTVIQVALRAKL